MGIFSVFSKEKKETLDRGLMKTKQGVFQKITRAVMGKNVIDEDVLEGLEEALITSDVGVETTSEIIEMVQRRVEKDKYMNVGELNQLLSSEIASLLSDSGETGLEDFHLPSNRRPYVIMAVGVNGVGKTTTIGKLAHQYARQGYRVVLGAADTFRAAAVEQLEVWAQRTGSQIVKQKMGADPASVAFDTVTSARASGADVVIVDTAGRLHNKIGLMNELTKIRSAIGKVVPGAPDEVLLVLDASTGQNAFEQARQFARATRVTGLAVTKLDGTAKGGVVLGISHQLSIPVRYIGLGEGIDDLQVFHGREFVDSLFNSVK